MKKILLILTCAALFWQCSDDDLPVTLVTSDVRDVLTSLEIPSSSETAPLQAGRNLVIEGIGFRSTDQILLAGKDLNNKDVEVEAQVVKRDDISITILIPNVVGNVAISMQRGYKVYNLGSIYVIHKEFLLADQKADYYHIILIGQSLATGWEAPEAITQEPIEGNYMWGNNVNVLYNKTNGLQPLVANKWENGGEQPIVAAVNSFSGQWRTSVSNNQKFIASTSGEGGRSIEQLSKKCTNGSSVQNNLYATTFYNHIKTIKSAVEGDSKTVFCPAIVFMQGEFNYPSSNINLGMTSGTHATTSKKEYKALLVQLKNDMQEDIMKTYGQTEKPLFFIYQTAGHYISLKEMSINMAQVEFAQENNDVVLLPPTYQTSDYGGGHLSTNGYRWYGEYIGKAFTSTFIEKKEYEPIYPTNFSIEDKNLKIEFHVPRLPLVFDTWTTPEVNNYGFKLFQDGNEIGITNVKISRNEVTLTAPNVLSGIIEVSYAGQGTNGTGNLRDNDSSYTSFYTYFNDSNASHKESYTPRDKAGNLLYGQSYPLQNWCIPFYMKVN